MATSKKDPSAQVSEYIDGLPAWSQALCRRLRALILAADPTLTEEWKWGPHYSSGGMVCGYGAFQKHIKLTFFNGSAMSDSRGLFNHCTDNAFSRSIKLVEGDPIDEEAISAYVREAVAVNQKGFKREIKDKSVVVPEELLQALARSPQAQAFFEALSYGYKKEFVELVTTAKQEATRRQRIARVVQHCAEGKKLNDKYKKEPKPKFM